MPFNILLIVLLLSKSTAPHIFMPRQASLRQSFFSAPLSSPAGLATSFSRCCTSSTLSMLHFTSRGCITWASFLSFSPVLSFHSSTPVDIKKGQTERSALVRGILQDNYPSRSQLLLIDLVTLVTWQPFTVTRSPGDCLLVKRWTVNIIRTVQLFKHLNIVLLMNCVGLKCIYIQQKYF